MPAGQAPTVSSAYGVGEEERNRIKEEREERPWERSEAERERERERAEDDDRCRWLNQIFFFCLHAAAVVAVSLPLMALYYCCVRKQAGATHESCHNLSRPALLWIPAKRSQVEL